MYTIKAKPITAEDFKDIFYLQNDIKDSMKENTKEYQKNMLHLSVHNGQKWDYHQIILEKDLHLMKD